MISCHFIDTNQVINPLHEIQRNFHRSSCESLRLYMFESHSGSLDDECMNGFLGAKATFTADFNLVAQLVMGLLLLIGMILARRQRFRLHAFCQSAVMILNLALIFAIMLPQFRRQVIPQVPSHFSDNYYSSAFIHAALGTLAELLGLYVVLVGTKLLPETLRFTNYKAWMRTTLALWWITILFGVGTYYFWYLRTDHSITRQTITVDASAKALPMPSNHVTVKVTNFFFQPQELTVPVGTTVEWVDETGRHSVLSDQSSFKSEALAVGDRFIHQFNQPGQFPYYCEFHGDKGGELMSGVIIVVEKQKQ